MQVRFARAPAGDQSGCVGIVVSSLVYAVMEPAVLVVFTGQQGLWSLARLRDWDLASPGGSLVKARVDKEGRSAIKLRISNHCKMPVESRGYDGAKKSEQEGSVARVAD
jgi:hypothetical protein